MRNNTNKKKLSTTNKLRWFARSLSVYGAAAALIWVIGGFLTEVERGNAEINFGDVGKILIFVLVGILIVLLGFWREIIWGIILTVSGLGFFTAFLIAGGFNLNFLLKGLFICIPILLSGLLYLICWRRMRKQGILQATT